MKKLGAVLGICSLLLGPINAQNQHTHTPGRSCFAHDKLQEQLQQDPAMQDRMRTMEENTQRYLKENRQGRANQTRTIPIYVHVLWRTAQENISTAQIQSQIDVLNKDFGGTNTDLGNVPSEFNSVKSLGTGIQFVLAGVNRKQTSKTSWGTNDDMKKLSRGGINPVTPATHMNMWICNIGGGILGYAQFPGGAASTDGVVFSPQYCGSSDASSSFYLTAPFDKGRTAVHEVGHYLNLRHIWGDGNCSADDFVGDTPLSSTANYGCPSYPTRHCNTSDMFMNYMDYVDDRCMFMFSKGQEDRMWAALNTTRAQLGTTTGTGGGGGGTPPACTDNEVTLNLTFDNYASETSWAITNSAGQTLHSGNGYADGDNSITETFCLPDGCYNFTINDSYGDGICCSYGSGSYSLTANGSTLANGASFTSSETKQICFNPTTCVKLDLNFDNYASETSWALKNSAGQTLHSGNGYANGDNNFTKTFCLPSGCYDFVINDSYGDGICCSYGSGSYSLTANGSTLASGASFTSSETKQICVGGATARIVGNNATTDAISNLEEIQINLYPNPATNLLNIEVLNYEASCLGRIIDGTGRTLWTGDIEEGNNAINLDKLATGIYYFTAVQKDGVVITKKFVKKG